MSEENRSNMTTRRADSIVVNPDTGEVESINGEPVEKQTPALQAFAAQAIEEGVAAHAEAEDHTASREAAAESESGEAQ